LSEPASPESLLTTAERTGAGYVNLSNTYGYGPADAPLTEDRPLSPTTVKGRVRAQMWENALAAHRDGRIRFTEVRPGDFIGPGQLSVFNNVWMPSLSPVWGLSSRSRGPCAG
jgi:nucleoside-diphosphate-sugar epimerase